MITFDPDKFVLTKEDFLNILDNIGDRWKVNKKDNWRLILSIETAKLYFKMQSNETIQSLWSEIIKEINEVLIDNTIAVDKITKENALKVFKQIRDRKIATKRK